MQSTPRTRRTPQNTQYTYTLGRRIHHVKTYPVQSPQGATILLYGHENGVTVVWRGGRRLKPQTENKSKEKSNGSTSNAIMITDSDEEDVPPPFVDKPEFEDSPTSTATPPLAEIIQTLDLAFGTAVLKIAVLPMPNTTSAEAAWNGADILKQKIIFAVTCATSEVYLITLPLTPPSNESKARPELRESLLAANAGKGVWGETLTLLGGQSRPCEGVAMTLAKSTAASRSRSVEPTTTQSQTRQSSRVIVAAHSREASGTLRFWNVPLDAKPGVISRLEPFQTEYLPSPLSSISFNPTQLTQLLTVSSTHAVRLYDYSTPALPLEDASEGPFPIQGSWLLSLYPPFTRSATMSTSRKPIVAAEWIAHGRAVLTLLADGQWGIWDIEDASPTATSAGSGGLFSKASAGLRGSAITNFSVTGHLEGTSPLKNPATQKSPAATGSSREFVPMTPHTRREALASANGGPEKLVCVRGGITVTHLSPAKGTATGDETALLWLGGSDPLVSVVPNVAKFWDSQLRKAAGGGNLWSGTQLTRMARLTDLGAGLLGERCTGAAAIPKPVTANNSSASENGTPPVEASLPVEVLIQGESRVVFVHESEDAPSFTSRLLGARKKVGGRTDLEPAKAILAYPRPEKPNSVAFNLSIAHRPASENAALLRSVRRPAAAGGLFSQDQPRGGDSLFPSVEAPAVPSQGASQTIGLRFINDLNFAADQPDDEQEAINRNIEEEMMDIMEIDRELEQMEDERERSTKRVFFEEG
ncbi:Nucleoporin Nup37 [Podospora pseudopauciseta]|uniref:Nucleoporin Nup37 n=1 Tax=Podospora pseudopauciseta TaxID=2093780 RepID=A0ABR0H964_9PEZI|nr:Nucleoporin Nup37 [Podospora pseudopauciseta]